VLSEWWTCAPECVVYNLWIVDDVITVLVDLVLMLFSDKTSLHTMGEEKKLLYILVEDEEWEEELGQNGDNKMQTHRYTRPMLQSTLQLMGCKPRHAFKISDNVFEAVHMELPPKKGKHHQFDVSSSTGPVPLTEIPKSREKLYDTNGFKVHPKPRKKRLTATISREKFLDVVCHALAQYQYLGPKQRTDLMVACRIRERKESVTVLLCGTSGCGKSTLASLLVKFLPFPMALLYVPPFSLLFCCSKHLLSWRVQKVAAMGVQTFSPCFQLLSQQVIGCNDASFSMYMS
jgi:hypothetical protein